MGDKFGLLALDKTALVTFINEVGAVTSDVKNRTTWEKVTIGIGRFMTDSFSSPSTSGFSSSDRDAIVALGLESHDARKNFLREKLGVDAATSEDFRIVAYTDDFGHEMLFKGRMDGEKKLILTESLAVSHGPEKVQQLLKSGFKPLLKPIELELQSVSPTKDGDKIEVSPEQKKKFQTEASFASALQNSGDVQLTSNARLPAIQQTVAASLMT